MSRRGRGNRGGAFSSRGRGTNYTSSVSSESNVTLQFNVRVSNETIEIHNENSNINRGRGSRRRTNYRSRGGFQSQAGTTRGQSHASSRENFQKPRYPVPCKSGGTGKVPHAEKPISHTTVNKPSRGPAQGNIGMKCNEGNERKSKSQSLPVEFCNLGNPAVGKTPPSSRGQSRGGKRNPHRGKKMDHSAEYGGSGRQESSNRKKMDNMKKSVSCGICLEVWTRPKTLPCEHVFCEKCLEKIVIRSRQVVTCPECRQEHNLPSQGLRNSWFTQRHLESLADDFKSLKT